MFPTIDFVTRCKLVKAGGGHASGDAITTGDFQRLGIDSKAKVIEEVNNMRVILSKDTDDSGGFSPIRGPTFMSHRS